MMPRSLRSLIWAVSATVVLSSLAGCATSYEMKVDAITQKNSAPTQVAAVREPLSYKIKNKNPAVDEEGLRYKEAVDYVKTALSGKGMYEAPTLDSADMIVELDYGMDQPRVHMQESTVPVYADKGGGVRYEQVPVAAATGASMRTVPVYDPPNTELIGYENVLTPVTVYEKYLHISARENKQESEGKAPAEVWSVNISSEDESNDLRKYLPLLASASIAYIGKDSNTQQTIKIKENDQAVGFVKKGM